MTMADTVAVMNGGRVEQLGPPRELYELPRTAFVANFLGKSNLIAGDVVEDRGDAVVVSAAGNRLAVRKDRAAAHRGRVPVGIRPEKLRLAADGVNTLRGTVRERAYVGVSTQYVVATPVGEVTVYVQGAGVEAPGDELTLSFAPESTFVVEREEAAP